MNFTWNDRRPIGMWHIARNVTENNLDGLFSLTNVDDEKCFIKNAITETKRVITNCQKINAQGVYIHSLTNRFIPKHYPQLERIEYQNPDQLPEPLKYRMRDTDAPEPLFERMMNMLLDAGLIPGCLITTSYPRGVFTRECPYYLGQVPIDRDLVFNYLKPRIDWAYALGMRFFYLDSPGNQEYMESYISLFLKTYPDCLFFPEITPSNNLYQSNEEFKYQYGTPWTYWNLNTNYFSKGYAVYFSCDQTPNQTNEQLKNRIRSAYIRRSIVGPMVWWNSRGLRLTEEVVTEEGSNS